MPKGTQIKIEVSFISIRKDYIKETEEDLLVFIYQLCKSDTDEIRQMLIDTEFFVKKKMKKMKGYVSCICYMISLMK